MFLYDTLNNNNKKPIRQNKITEENQTLLRDHDFIKV